MEVAVINNTSFKIKTKNSTFVVNPEKKIDGEVVILTEKPTDYAPYAGKIVFDGPGEYEVAGVSIKGEVNAGKVSFDLLEEDQRLLVLTAGDTEKSKEADDYTATVVLADSEMSDSLKNITSGVVMVVGANIPSDPDNVKKIDKLNLKKVDEFKGFLVHLTKN